jgi:putative membrane protein
MITALFLSAAIYRLGLSHLRAATKVPAKLRREAWYYAGGWLALAIALVSPLHPWGQILFAAHMTQHEVLMLIAAPLLVLGQPGLVFLWALSRADAQRAGRWTKQPLVAMGWNILNRPLAAWVVHAVALWVWHIPAWFEATLEHEWIHHVQHASFFLSALLFWHSIFRGPQRVSGYGAGVLYLFTTAVHSGALGALITFATRVWYPHYSQTSPSVGLTALQDQQLGGLIMWIPASLVYVIAALLMAAHWLRHSDPRPTRSRAADLPPSLNSTGPQASV